MVKMVKAGVETPLSDEKSICFEWLNPFSVSADLGDDKLDKVREAIAGKARAEHVVTSVPAMCA